MRFLDGSDGHSASPKYPMGTTGHGGRLAAMLDHFAFDKRSLPWSCPAFTDEHQSPPMATQCTSRIIQTCRVSPPPGSVAEVSLPITFAEIFWLHLPPVERIFFYRLPPSTSSTASFIDSVLPDLKHSLSLALLHFYPLAGKIRRSAGSSDDDYYRYELHYADGDSVSFTVSEYDADFNYLSGRHEREMERLKPMVAQLPRPDDDDAARPVLALQATVFPGCGVAIGVTVHHSASDGSTTMRFVASWASACRSGGLVPVVSPPPVIDKSLCSDPGGRLYSFYSDLDRRIRDALRTVPAEAADEVGRRCATFVISQQQIEKLKKLVLAGAEERKMRPFHCSTVVVVYAHVWTCITRALGMDGDEVSHAAFAADFRGRMRPPLPEEYFGSCVIACFVEAKASQITNTDGGFLTACEAMGRTIERFKTEGVESSSAGAADRLFSRRPMSVAGAARLKVYETDFGWGRPEKVEVTSVRGMENISVAENRDEVTGGVEIGLVSSKEDLDAFGTCFFDGLRTLLG